MIELFSNDYHIAESFFAGKKHYVPALSVIHGNFPGRVFVNEALEPSMAIVWAIGRWMYLGGDIKSGKDKTRLITFVHDVVVPDCRQRGAQWFEIYTADSKCWDEIFLQELNTLQVDKHYESTYALNIDQFHKTKANISSSENLAVHLSEMNILPEEYHHFPYVDEKFKMQTCPGVEVRLGDEVVAVCRNNGFVYKDEYFMDADTFAERHRGKGYATLAAVRLIDHLINHRMFPLWETTHQNIPSHKLALKLGFEAVESYPVFAFAIPPISS